jgi:hypothetical protein
MAADLSGRAALVTGAASGIGRASALAFASAGASVALLDVDAEGLADTAATARAAGVRAEALVADVRDLGAVAAARPFSSCLRWPECSSRASCFTTTSGRCRRCHTGSFLTWYWAGFSPGSS